MGILGVLSWLINEEKNEGSWGFNFRFLMSCHGMLRHELKTRTLARSVMSRHKKGMAQHVALGNLYGK